MKYGLLTYFGAPYCNFGDYVQSIAIEYLYLEIMKIPKDQIVYITEQELKSYDGEQLILPYSYVLAFLLDKNHEKAEISNKITVVFLGASVEFAMLYDAYPLDNFFDSTKGYYNLFLKYSPVGCRDNFTKELLQRHGISAYLQGCITNIFPFRKEKPYKKVFLIDVPAESLQHIPQKLLENAEILSNAEEIMDLSFEQNYQKIKERYEYYRDNAALIISSRYHVVTPCNAMGIPCIFVRRTVDKHRRDIRLDTLHPEIQIVYDNDFSRVDFQRRVDCGGSFYEMKQQIIELASSRISTVATLYQNTQYIYEFFKPRIEWFQQMPDADISYKNRLLSYITAYHANSKGKYYIWGAIKLLCNGNSVGLVELVKSVNPKLKFTGWIDTFKTGILAQRRIFSPQHFMLEDGDFVIVAAETAVETAVQCFTKKGYGKEQYLILANTMAVQGDIEAELKRRTVGTEE